MAHHIVVGSEPHPTKRGHSLRWYATVDIALSGASWYWRMVERDGQFLGPGSPGFPTVERAKEDALAVLLGDRFE